MYLCVDLNVYIFLFKKQDEFHISGVSTRELYVLVDKNVMFAVL